MAAIVTRSTERRTEVAASTIVTTAMLRSEATAISTVRWAEAAAIVTGAALRRTKVSARTTGGGAEAATSTLRRLGVASSIIRPTRLRAKTVRPAIWSTLRWAEMTAST